MRVTKWMTVLWSSASTKAVFAPGLPLQKFVSWNLTRFIWTKVLSWAHRDPFVTIPLQSFLVMLVWPRLSLTYWGQSDVDRKAYNKINLLWPVQSAGMQVHRIMSFNVASTHDHQKFHKQEGCVSETPATCIAVVPLLSQSPTHKSIWSRSTMLL